MDQDKLNPTVLGLDDLHPAKRFLTAFVQCRDHCVGRHLDPQEPIDQQWDSEGDGRMWTFSGFAYAFLSLDLALGEFHAAPPSSNEATSGWPWDLPRVRMLMHECAEAARKAGNSEILELTDEVLNMLDLWDDYLAYRKEMISKADD